MANSTVRELITIWNTGRLPCCSRPVYWRAARRPVRPIRLVLNQDLVIPAGQAHTIVQNANAGTSAFKLEVMCRFEVEQLGPRTIHPDTFLITQVAQGREWVNEPSTLLFYKDLHLQSEKQQEILPMRCGYTYDPLLGRPLTIEQIRETLGSEFTLVPGREGGNPQ